MGKTEEFNVTNEQEFQELMESIDSELRNEGYLIFQRPFLAEHKISSRYKLTLIQPTPKRDPIEGCYTGFDLSIRIHRWYEQRYGDRVKFNPNWEIAILIRGDAYKMRLPLIFGAVKATCSIETFGKITSVVGINSQIPELNVLDLIEGLTESYVKSFKRDELIEIFNAFRLGNSARNEIEIFNDKTLITQARGDIEAAVVHIFANPPQYGLSKWSSLQATEKFIKAFIEEKGSKFKFTHDIKELVQQAEKVGLHQIPDILINSVQCSAGVRYGETKVNLSEAISAHHACLDICLGISKQIHTIQRAKLALPLIPGKYYVNSFDKNVRCIRVESDEATMMLFDEVQGNPLEVIFTVKKEFWSEYIGLDIWGIIQPLEERFQARKKLDPEMFK